MPRRYQNAKLEIRRDVNRPYYFVRVTEPVIDGSGHRVKRRVAKPIGFLDEMTKKEAMVARATILEAANAPRMAAQSRLLFRHVAQRFLEVRVPQLGAAVQGRYPSQIKNHLLPAFGALKMSEIDRPMVEQFCTAKKNEGLSAWSVIGLKGVLSAIFTTAASWKLFEGTNPCNGVKVKKKLVREKKLLTGEQLLAVLSGLEDRERFIVQILFGTGLRISECLGLKWSDIDTEAGTLTVARRWYRGDIDDPKTETSERTLELGEFLTGEFKRRYPGPNKRESFVFTVEGGSLPPDDRDLLREYFRPVVRRLGLYYNGFGWHAFRRQNITLRQQHGATPLEAMRQAGHSSLDMTLNYTLADKAREKGHVDSMFSSLMPNESEVKH